MNGKVRNQWSTATLWIVGLLFILAGPAGAQGGLPVSQDPLVRMPGTQPGTVQLDDPGQCFNCHSGFDPVTEPGFHWSGSMMAQAARDFLFFTCMTVAAQDSQWAIGRPNATDLCLRCHFPEGWLAGRSDPTNASLMTRSDYDGVHCAFCHSLYDPFFESTFQGTREGSDWLNYWDETGQSATPSQPAADTTRLQDQADAGTVDLYNGNPFFSGNQPFTAAYSENTGGQYFSSTSDAKRASFADAGPNHSFLYSRFHKSKYFCGTCHDVSNPALANLAFDGTPPGDGVTILPSEQNPGHLYYHVERTFSEFVLSDYGLEGGAPGIGPYEPGVFSTSLPGNAIARCQDCHMPDVSGKACNKSGGVDRPAQSTEHPQSGVPQHDLQGGNAWVPYILASTVSGSPNYDPVNRALLYQPALLTLDFSQGEGLDSDALLAAVDRARQNLTRAASLENLHYDWKNGQLSFRIQNQTGHKLISGFPEGRRMFVNIRALSKGQLLAEVNAYSREAGTLKGLPGSPNSPALGPGESYEDSLVYEVHPTSALTGEQETFHFVLATGRYKDNRIPPRGFRIAEAVSRLAEPVWQGVSDPGYFTPEEYAGGHDDVQLGIVPGADRVVVRLYYQTTSREYVEFLRDEINGVNGTLPPEAYVAQTDSFYAGLRAWGDTMWQLWQHNKDVPGAAPILMAEAAVRAAKLPTGTWSQ